MGEPNPLPMVNAWRRRKRIGRWLLGLWLVFAVFVTGLYLTSLFADWQTFWVTGGVFRNASGHPARVETHARLSDGCFSMVTQTVFKPGGDMHSFETVGQDQGSKSLAWYTTSKLQLPRWPQAYINGWPAYWQVPLWPGAAFAAVVTVLVGGRFLRRPKAWQCKGRGCRYDLRGQAVRAGEQLVCPECGRMNQCPVCGHPTGGAVGEAACAECGWRI